MQRSRFEFDIAADVDTLVQRSGIDLERLRGKTVFLTGGTGFFGLWFLRALVLIRRQLGGNLRLIVLSRAPNRFLAAHPAEGFDREVEFVGGEVTRVRLDPQLGVTHLIHMATTCASETFGGEDQVNKLDLLYRGTRNILEQCGQSLESVLFTSSGVVYGTHTRDRVIESDCTRLETTYAGSALGIGKLAAEYLVAAFAAKQHYQFSIARCFSFAGQHLPMDLHYAFGNFILSAIKNTPISIRSDGQDRRSYMYVGDAVAWLLRLLVEPKNGIYNVGSSTPVTIEALARLISASAPQPVPIETLGGTFETGNFRRVSYVPATDKIRHDYPDLAEWTSLEDITHKMLNPVIVG